METFKDYLDQIKNKNLQTRMRIILTWILIEYPDLETRMSRNKPIFIHNGALVIGFSAAKNHLSILLEPTCLNKFLPEIQMYGYSHTNNLFRMKWTEPLNYNLMRRIITSNLD